MNQEFKATQVRDLEAPAKALKNILKPGDVVCFNGEMGVGKTTFIKVLLREMGVKEEVDSPTFALVNEYRLPDGLPVFHFDFYRLSSVREALDIGLEDYLDMQGICLMEWPKLVEDFLPEDAIEVTIRDVNEVRQIVMKSKTWGR